MRSPLLLSLPARTAFTALTALVALALSPAATTTAHGQTIYNDVASFNAVAAGNTLYTFEGVAPSGDSLTNPNLAPLTFSVTGGTDSGVRAASRTFGGGFYSLNGTDSLLAGFTDDVANPAITRIDLGAAGQTFTAFGTEIGQTFGANTPLTNQYLIALYLGDSQVGTTYTSADSTPNGTFFGITSVPAFDNVRFTALRARSRYTVFDNVRTGNVTPLSTAAPEPGSLALLLPVVGVAGMVIRKRRKK